jgi:hypothetical protein
MRKKRGLGKERPIGVRSSVSRRQRSVKSRHSLITENSRGRNEMSAGKDVTQSVASDFCPVRSLRVENAKTANDSAPRGKSKGVSNQKVGLGSDEIR